MPASPCRTGHRRPARRRGWLAALALGLLAGCGPDAPHREAEAPAGAPPGGLLTAVGAIDLGDRGDAHALSGLWVAPDGGRIVAVSDRGHRFVAELQRDAEGRIVGARRLDFGALGSVGHKHDRTSRDAEAIVGLPGGGWIVAFERDHRLARYRPGAEGLDGPAEPVALPDAARHLPGNAGIEALARLADDALLAVAEAKTGPGFSHPAWIGGPGGWQRFGVAAAPGWAPVDAAALPSGDVLLLERWYLPWFGFRSRLSVLPAAEIARVRTGAGGAAEVLEPVRLAALEPEIGRDNYEGLAVRPLADGALELLIVSDDNVPSDDQRPILLQYRLDAAAAGSRLAAAAD